MKTEYRLACPLCGGLQEEGVTTFSVDLGFGVVVVRQVPAMVCDMCGEAFIDDDVAELLERIVEQTRRRRRTVEIVQYDREVKLCEAS